MNSAIEKAGTVSEAAECYSLVKTGMEVEFEHNELKGLNYGEHSGSALRVVCDGKIGFSTSTKKDDEDNLLSAALRVVPYGRPYDFAFSDSTVSSIVKCSDSAVEDFSVEEMVDIGKDIISAIRIYDSDILAFASVGKSVYTVTIANSAGVDKEYKKTIFSVCGGGKLTEEGNFLQLYDYAVAHSVVKSAEIEQIKKKIQHDLAIAKKNVPVDAGRFSVLFSPRAVGDLLAPVSVCSNAKNVQKGVSPWRDSIGEKVFDENITIYDDGTAKDGIASCPFDDEGVPTSKTALIDKGVVKGFYHNLATASALHMTPTGNGLRGRSIGASPSPSTTNLVMAGGEITAEDMIKGVSKGIFIDQLMGTFTSNHLGGQVSGNISLGYKIDDGVKVGRIKNCMLSVNVFDVLKNNVRSISKESVWKGSSQFPYILLDDIFISTTKWKKKGERG